MKNRSMMEYFSDIKAKYDAIAIFEQPLSTEDIIHYTLNGLPHAYQPFKIVIQTNLHSINLDNFYALLCSEELHIVVEISKENSN